MVFEDFFHLSFKRKRWGSSKPWESTCGHISVLFQGPGNIKLSVPVCVCLCVNQKVNQRVNEKTFINCQWKKCVGVH